MSADIVIDKDKWWSVRGGFFKDMMNLASARTPNVVVQHLLGYSAFVGCLNISSYGDQNIQIELCRCLRLAATEEIAKLRATNGNKQETTIRALQELVALIDEFLQSRGN